MKKINFALFFEKGSARYIAIVIPSGGRYSDDIVRAERTYGPCRSTTSRYDFGLSRWFGKPVVYGL
jgi:hypothetical protein